jgi:hypothetical protein
METTGVLEHGHLSADPIRNRVLIVEDNPVSVEAAKFIFFANGFAESVIDTVPTAEGAIDQVSFLFFFFLFSINVFEGEREAWVVPLYRHGCLPGWTFGWF